MSSKIECLESDGPDDELILICARARARTSATVKRRDAARGFGRRTRVQRRLMNLNTVLLQHVEQRRLAGIVEAEEQNLALLVIKACAAEGRLTSVRSPRR